MKKIFGFIALVMAVSLLPMGAKAASVSPKCDKSCTTENGKCTATCTISVEGNNTTLTSFQTELQITGDGVTVKSFTASDGWTKVSPTDTELSGKAIPVSLVSTEGVKTENFTLATFTLELESSATDCSLKISNPSIGSEITIEIETTTETKTGAALPIAIIAFGAVGAGVIYSVTKKNKKMYKI